MIMRSAKRAHGFAAFLGASVTLAAVPAGADSMSEEIRLLKARLKLLEAKVSQQARAAKADKQARAAPPASAQTAAAAGLPGPDHFYFKGLEITPGGFFAAESVYRSHWMGADNNTPFQNIPFGFMPGAHETEWRATARPSRPNLMIRADIDKQTHIMAFGEVDFLGAAQTANSNQSNSYNLRLRQAYGNVDFDEYGLHVAAGQMWSLVTMNSVGIRPDTSLQPLTIDHQYLPGYVWARTPGFRITKDFNKQFWAAFSIESTSATFALPGSTPFGTTSLPLIGAPLLLSAPAAGGLFNGLNTYPFTRMPDMIGKVAWDGELAERKIHVEGFGLLRDVTDRAYGGNHSQWGGGAGGGVVVQLMPKLLDFQFSGMIGNGIGNYGAGQLPVATFQLSGAPQLVSERLAMAGLILHPTAQTEVYAFAGGEFAGKRPQWATVGRTLMVGGYGNPLYDNSGCGLENDAATAAGVALGTPLFPCAGQTKSLRQITGGIWHTLYQGPFGRIRAGAQYSYTVRDGFAGFGATPRGTENMVYTSLRYYPFDGPVAITPALTK
ncbi:hypothetical protein MJC1_02894 [Methylocystis sp. MJC1]|jgi:hypothetical protein|uniref:hypothetical protein n=2 Tax=Methylocystis sp. MJC1 TaxID=2654282 RepID=UPI001FEE6B77|nr:hypothetical protein [Methylocystis sp. MJC1]KAF2989977.1 hypothetical protein MJC1_02894 [Methylocystis sp. MJC1]